MKKLWNKYKHQLGIAINVLFVLTSGYVTYDFIINGIIPDKLYFSMLALIGMLFAISNSLDSVIVILDNKLKSKIK